MKTIKKLSLLILCFVLLFGQNAHNIKAEENNLGSIPDVGNTDLDDENNIESEPGNTEPKPEEGTEPETGTGNTEPEPEEEKDILETDMIEATQPVLWTDVADTSWYDENETTYEISTPYQLAGLAKLSISSGGQYVNFKDKTITLLNDIDLSGLIWVPIGGLENIKQENTNSTYTYTGSYVPFRGTFDGNNKTISNANILYENNDGGTLGGFGLFGYVESAVIKNLNIVDSALTYMLSERTYSELGAGLLVGDAHSVTIEKVNLNDNKMIIDVKGLQVLSVGGFVGYEYNCIGSNKPDPKKLREGVKIVDSSINELKMEISYYDKGMSHQSDFVLIGGAIGSFAFLNEIDLTNYDSYIRNTTMENINIDLKIDSVFDYSNIYTGGVSGYTGGSVKIENIDTNHSINFLLNETLSNLYHGGVTGSILDDASISGSKAIISSTNVVEKMNFERRGNSQIIGGIPGLNGLSGYSASIIDCATTITSSSGLTGAAGNIIGYWATTRDGRTDNVYNNISNNDFLSEKNKYKLAGQIVKNNAALSDNVSKNWILEANLMKVNEAGEPITYRQVAEKTKEESIYTYYTPVYQADSMADAGENKVTFGEVNAKTPLSITLNPVDTSSYISHTFNKDIRVVENIGEITGNVEGTDLDGSEVRIFHGNNEIAFKTTDASGKYTFTNIPYGIYNLEVKKGNRVIVVKIEIKQDTTTQNVKLPTETLNTEIVGNDANTVVEGIYDNFTQEDKTYAADSTQSVKINFSANEVEDTDETKKIIKELPKDMNVEQFIDMKLVKQNYKDNAADGPEIQLRELSDALTIYIPIPESVMASNDLITIYRYHEDATGIQVVEELPNNLTGDEGFEIDGNYIKLKSMKFSTYALVMKPNGYKVEFEFIGEVPSSAVLPVEQNVKAGEKIVEPTIRSISGYKFKGWFEDKSGTNKFNFKQIINSAKVLYGLWEKETSGGGGSPSRPDEPNVDEPSEPEVPEENPTVPEEPLEPEEPVETPNTDVVPPNTGYNSNIMLYLVIALSSAFIIFSILFDRRKKMTK